MSRIERTPTVSLPSTTTRWRKPPLIIASAARSSDQSGAAKVRWAERWSPTFSSSGDCPDASDSSRSRSVMIPGPCDSGSTTTAAPTLRWAICRAASRSVCPGPIVKTTELIPSLTCIDTPPSYVRIGSSVTHGSGEPPCTRTRWHKSTHPIRALPRIGGHDHENWDGCAPKDPLRGGRGDHRARVRPAARARRRGPPPGDVAAPAPARVLGDRRHELPHVRRARENAPSLGPAPRGPAPGARGGQQRGLPPARAVREDVPAPPRGAAVELPRAGRQPQRHRDRLTER